jgi:acetyl esterase/lipase
MDTTKQVIELWPDGAPGSENWDQVEEELTTDFGMTLVRNTTRPRLTVYPAEKPNGAAVIIAPGGAFHFTAIEHEGRQVASWLAARGITAFILNYRVLRTGPDLWSEVQAFMEHKVSKDAEMHELMGMTRADAARAVCIVRERAVEWGIDPARVGFMGFSAGGAVTVQAVLNEDPAARPNFAAPVYAAVFDEVLAPADAPPLFLLCTADDEMAARASLKLYSAWRAARRPVEMHIYAKGEHGFGMRRLGQAADTWIERFEDWMKDLGVI